MNPLEFSNIKNFVKVELNKTSLVFAKSSKKENVDQLINEIKSQFEKIYLSSIKE